MRVYVKAKELGVTSRTLLHFLAKNGCGLGHASCNLTPESLRLIAATSLVDIRRMGWFAAHPEPLAPRPPWPQLVTGDQAAQIAGVEAATIRQWVKRGHLVRADLRGHSRSAMYHLDDVLAARLRTRQQRREKVPVYRVPWLSAQNFDSLMVAREAAQYLDIPESTIRSWARRGRLDASGRRGRFPLYRLADIYSLIKSRRRPELDIPQPATHDDWDYDWDDDWD